MTAGRRRSRVGVVTGRELRIRLRSRAYQITTLAAPLLLAALVQAPALLSRIVGGKVERVALLDETGEIAPALERLLESTDRYEVRSVPRGTPEARLRGEVAAGGLDGYLVIPRDVWEGEPTSYVSRTPRGRAASGLLQTLVSGEVLRRRMMAAGLDSAQVAFIDRPVELRTLRVAEGESAVWGAQATLAQALVIVLYVAIIVYGVSIKSAVTEEKATRTAELLFSSVRPFDLLAGKLLGTGLAALLQFAIWMGAGLLVLRIGSRVGLAAALEGSGPALWAAFLFFFTSGFFLYGSLYLMLGAVASSHEEAQQTQLPATLVVVVAFLLSFYVMTSPEGAAARWLSFFPLFSPILLFSRIALGVVPPWEMALGAGIVLISIVLAVGMAARVYRVAMLLPGRRPGLRRLLGWIWRG